MVDEPIYLDYNATAPARPDVIDMVTRVMSTVGNASSVHRAGQVARKTVETARAEVAALVGAQPENVIFTSGGTEANNLALKGFGDRHLIVSGTEHGAVLAPAVMRDPDAVILAVDADGLIELSALEAALAAATKPCLVSVMLANNETGLIQPHAEIARIAHAHDAMVHCDGVQAAGKIPLDMDGLGIDLLTLAAHKIGGPQGVGALVMRQDFLVAAQIVGGGQELGRRSGTENVAGIAGFGVAARLAKAGLADYAGLAALRDDMERRLRAVAPGLRVYGGGVERLPNTSCLTMPGVSSETQVMSFDLAGIAVSAGSACSSGKVAASHVLEAMAADRDEAMTAIRVSLGWNTTPAEIDRFVVVWEELYSRLGNRADAA